MKIFKRGEDFGTIANTVEVGTLAPDFEMVNLANEKITLANYKGEVVLISVFPDINTSVCDTQTRRFFADANKFAGVKILNVSNNTVEELDNWCAAAGLEVDMLSDTALNFANAYGLHIPEVGVLARSIFLVDKDGKVVYKEVLSEVTDEPNYEAVLAKTKELV